jgi:hypothetical protein
VYLCYSLSKQNSPTKWQLKFVTIQVRSNKIQLVWSTLNAFRPRMVIRSNRTCIVVFFLHTGQYYTIKFNRTYLALDWTGGERDFPVRSVSVPGCGRRWDRRRLIWGLSVVSSRLESWRLHLSAGPTKEGSRVAALRLAAYVWYSSNVTRWAPGRRSMRPWPWRHPTWAAGLTVNGWEEG